MKLSNDLYLDTEYKADVEHKINYLNINNVSKNTRSKEENNPTVEIASGVYKIIEEYPENQQENNQNPQ